MQPRAVFFVPNVDIVKLCLKRSFEITASAIYVKTPSTAILLDSKRNGLESDRGSLVLTDLAAAT